MTIELIHHTPLHISSRAIRKCWKSDHLSDSLPYEVDYAMDDTEDFHLAGTITCGTKDAALIDRIGNKMKHASTLEFLDYTFDCNDISTKTLLALTRHRVGTSFAVESTRYTTKKRADDLSITYTKKVEINSKLDAIMKTVAEAIEEGHSNDDIAMLLPQAYNYSFVFKANARAVQHLLELRTNKAAHWDIQEFAHSIFNALPEDHKYLFEHCIHTEES